MSKRQVTIQERRRGLPWWGKVLLAGLTGATAAVVSTAGGRGAMAPAVEVTPAAVSVDLAGPPAPEPTVAPSTTAVPAGVSCHPGYQGTCIPASVSDADCYGMNENGPWFVRELDVRVVGDDVFHLDVDFDGVACESQPGLR